jgi:hypothetical protein
MHAYSKPRTRSPRGMPNARLLAVCNIHDRPRGKPANPHSAALNVAFVTSVRRSVESIDETLKRRLTWLWSMLNASGTAVAEVTSHRP